ncbi:MAG: sigma-70 family RNA polymerase sigma factor [Actinomycetota bacterium]
MDTNPTHHSQKETPANTTSNLPLPTPAGEKAYIKHLTRAATRIASKRGRQPFDVDDIVQGVLLRFAADVPRFMRDYTPERFAREATSQVAITFDRKHRVARYQGVRLVHVSEDGSEGYCPKARAFASGSEPILEGDGELLDLARSLGAVVDETVVQSEHDRAMLRACLQQLTPRQREFLMLVDGYGFTVTEVAARADLVRETVSRELSRARKLALQAAGNLPDDDEGVSTS